MVYTRVTRIELQVWKLCTHMHSGDAVVQECRGHSILESSIYNEELQKQYKQDQDRRNDGQVRRLRSSSWTELRIYSRCTRFRRLVSTGGGRCCTEAIPANKKRAVARARVTVRKRHIFPIHLVVYSETKRKYSIRYRLLGTKRPPGK